MQHVSIIVDDTIVDQVPLTALMTMEEVIQEIDALLRKNGFLGENEEVATTEDIDG
jgi:hypothetical protein